MIFENFFNKKTAKLVFIFGAPRGGTTWLWSLLESSSEVIPFIDGVKKNMDGSYPTSESGVYIKFPKKAKKKIKLFLKQHPNKTVIEKTPMHTLQYEAILNDFPNSTPLIILRYPLAIVNSILKSEMKAFASHDVVSAVVLVKEYYAKLIELSELKKAVLVRYEDLLADTEMELLKVFKQLNIETSDIGSIILQNDKTSKINIKGVFRSGQKNSFISEMPHEIVKQLKQELSTEIAFYTKFSAKN
ncbi:hypothetical protein ULMS_23220 [Patiriisocius marinistellae]|uniref:Sulfotransferase domain-containing protein n=1 Tax=Patiriisocius marinistellae TaxID=2494560 RepID=A0A5J4G012_9FLAO|nr:sulfotransferase [Patiriisocius marinistellae]GEQ86814.1 hypothetical protein ULMS_23220 [Patiriisocius marinistellae]